jgi:hypothetical protein
MLSASIDSSSQSERAAKYWTRRKAVPATRNAHQRVHRKARSVRTRDINAGQDIIGASEVPD